MTTFKSLNRAKAGKLLHQVLLFTNSFPIQENTSMKSSLIIDNIYKLLNVILYVETKDSGFNTTGNFRAENGKEENIDIIDRSDIFIQKLFNELKYCSSIFSTTHLVNIANSFLKLNGVSLFHKVHILDAENSLLKEHVENFLEMGSESHIKEFIELRSEIAFDAIYIFEENIKGDTHFNQDINALYNILNLYLGYNINFHIYRNQIFQIYSLLRAEFNTNEDERVKKIFLERLINLNSRFLIEPKAHILELFEDSGLFEGEEFDFQKMLIESSPMNGNIYNFQYSQGSITEEIVKNNKIVTIIRFSIPFGVKDNKSGIIELNKEFKLEFKGINSKFSDPVYRMYKDLSIGGMSWNFFSDTYNTEKEELCTMALIINDFYHPDFKFNEKGLVNIDFSEKKALTGREYFPHKELIIKSFLEHKDTVLDVLNIEMKDITIDLFSNYVVDYLNLNSNSIVSRKLYTITNPDSFTKASDKFIERLTELNLSDYFMPISELVNDTSIVSDRTLSLFMQKLIEIILKGNIELHSNYKYFWTKNKEGKNIPQREPDMQPLIASQLRTICDYMGIQLSREVESANGAIDFHCSYTYNGKLLKTCIELKNAHSPSYELGLTKQLPQYLKSERTRSGIYVVLWYKGKDFSEPKKYSETGELKKYLDGKRPNGFKTDVMIIDCSKPIVPSKLK